MALMKISFEIPDEWHEPLKDAAHTARSQSVADYIRSLIAEAIGVEKPAKTWGGRRDQQVQQDEQVAQDAALDLNPSEILAKRKAEAKNKLGNK